MSSASNGIVKSIALTKSGGLSTDKGFSSKTNKHSSSNSTPKTDGFVMPCTNDTSKTLNQRVFDVEQHPVQQLFNTSCTQQKIVPVQIAGQAEPVLLAGPETISFEQELVEAKISKNYRGRVILYPDGYNTYTAVTVNSYSKVDKVILEQSPRWHVTYLVTSCTNGLQFVHPDDLPADLSMLNKARFLAHLLEYYRLDGNQYSLISKVNYRYNIKARDYDLDALFMPTGALYYVRFSSNIFINAKYGTHIPDLGVLKQLFLDNPEHYVNVTLDLSTCIQQAIFHRVKRFSGTPNLGNLPKYQYDVDTHTFSSVREPDYALKGQVHLYTGAGGSGKTSRVGELLDGCPVVVVTPKVRLVSSDRSVKDPILQRIIQLSGALISLIGKGISVVDIVPYDEIVGRQFHYPVLLDDCQRFKNPAALYRDLVSRCHAGLILTYGIGQTSGWSPVYELCSSLPDHTIVHAYSPLECEVVRSSFIKKVCVPGVNNKPTPVVSISPLTPLFSLVLYGICGNIQTGLELMNVYQHALVDYSYINCLNCTNNAVEINKMLNALRYVAVFAGIPCPQGLYVNINSPLIELAISKNDL